MTSSDEPSVVMLSSVCGKHFDESCYSCRTAKTSNDARLTRSNDEPTERERALQEIGNQIAYWLEWVTRERGEEGLETTADTHIMLANENAPPYWPTVGQLKTWLKVFRAEAPYNAMRSAS